jgi:hypothetical protein
MRSSPKGSAERLTTPADWFITTKRLLIDATEQREPSLLRRAAIRIDSARFNEMTDDQQADLLVQYSAAMMATGSLAP